MTDYATMPAGLELDALVAELRGWTAYREERGEYALSVAIRPGGEPPWENVQHAYREAARKRYTQITCSEAIALGFFGQGFPRFSTDIAAAIEVAEKLRLDGWTVFLEGDIDGWVVIIQETGDPHCRDLVSAYADAKTAALAICRAALAVMENTKENEA